MSSRRTIKTKTKQILQSGEEKPRFRKCVKTGCPADKPECFANGVERCNKGNFFKNVTKFYNN